MRIASLLASGTEIVTALGLADQLVGISHECDYPPEVLDLPRLSRPLFDPTGLSSGEVDRAVRSALRDHGSVYEVRADALEALRPDLILTQAVCDVCAVPTAGVREIVAARGIDARVLSLDAHTLEDILDTIEEVGEATGARREAAALTRSLRERLDAAAARATRERLRVLALEWLDPPFTPGHWVPQMITLAGGENLIGDAGGRSREMDWRELTGLDPDVLVVMPCGYGLDAARVDADRAHDRLREVAGRAIDAGRAYVVDASSYFNRSGPRVVRGVEILTELFRGAEPPDGEAARWPANS